MNYIIEGRNLLYEKKEKHKIILKHTHTIYNENPFELYKERNFERFFGQELFI